jgi:hypothetical protein
VQDNVKPAARDHVQEAQSPLVTRRVFVRNSSNAKERRTATALNAVMFRGGLQSAACKSGTEELKGLSSVLSSETDRSATNTCHSNRLIRRTRMQSRVWGSNKISVGLYVPLLG